MARKKLASQPAAASGGISQWPIWRNGLSAVA
jgi:hypothetical protein